MTQAPLLVIQHEDECPPGWFGEFFHDAGLDYEVVLAHRGRPIPRRLHSWSGLLVLGGDMGAYDDRTHPWLAATKHLIATCVSEDRPVLGICLGHQLAAVALGGVVGRNPYGHARGLTPLGHTSTGAEDTLVGAVPERSPTVMWNRDIVAQLPREADQLAISPDGTVQAARFAPKAWGVQFHPEASPDIFDQWTSNEAAAAVPQGIDVPAAAREIRAAEPELRRACRSLAATFAEIVLGAGIPVTGAAAP